MIWTVVRMVAALAAGVLALLPDTPWHWREFAVVLLVSGLMTLLVPEFRRRREAATEHG